MVHTHEQKSVGRFKMGEVEGFAHHEDRRRLYISKSEDLPPVVTGLGVVPPP